SETATGIWALEDVVISLDHQVTIRGAAFYRDEYVKIDGSWRIKHTGYERVFEEIEPRNDDVRLTARRSQD
ncbi:MAG TPA: nuclear transport factor 2 family protein, partial [Actinomycetota bacterium]|nr:nuclear transport factor 2 family protein [Actinomycetota bacterium]